MVKVMQADGLDWGADCRGTLPRGDQPYELKNATLQEEFREDLRVHLATETLRAVAPLADTEVRG